MNEEEEECSSSEDCVLLLVQTRVLLLLSLFAFLFSPLTLFLPDRLTLLSSLCLSICLSSTPVEIVVNSHNSYPWLSKGGKQQKGNEFEKKRNKETGGTVRKPFTGSAAKLPPVSRSWNDV